MIYLELVDPWALIPKKLMPDESKFRGKFGELGNNRRNYGLTK